MPNPRVVLITSFPGRPARGCGGIEAVENRGQPLRKRGRMTRSEPDVLVVGAGPTGLILAIELARRGIATRLIDRAGPGESGSRGKGLQPRALELFDLAGLR